MRYEVVLAPEAERDYKRLKAAMRADVRDSIEVHLRHEPMKTSKSGIKRLKGLAQPQYRLRVGDLRVFYDVEADSVLVLAIILKSEADRWLREAGKSL
jgi:mRNA interferase RelE/StbE